MKHVLSAVALLAFSIAASGQTPAVSKSGSPAFEVADVHRSPWVPPGTIYTDGGGLHGDRYSLRQATLLDLVARAYGVEPEAVTGGPPWIARDRFDIFAKAPVNTSPATLNLMLRSLLTERFHLVAKTESHPTPGYALVASNGKPKLKPAAGSGEMTCDIRRVGGPQDPPIFSATCRNAASETLADLIGGLATGNFVGGNIPYLNGPVVDGLHLTGNWDLDIQFTPKGQLAAAGSSGINLLDYLDKQLGLKLEARTVPVPALVVSSADREPTANVANIATLLPALPPPSFEVAVIRPSKETAGGFTRIDNSQVNAKGVTLYELIGYAWRLNQNDPAEFVNMPKWLNQTHYDLETKVTTANLGPAAQLRDDDDLRHMMQGLLMDRFHLKAHLEDRPLDAYTLTAPASKLKKTTDPAARSICMPGGSNPNPALNRTFTCKNMSMAEFAEDLHGLAAGYIFNTVADDTGLKDSYDFTFSFSGVNIFRRAAADPNGSSDLNGALDVFEAVNRQLGLKLEKTKRPQKVLVIDQIEQIPTEN